VINDSTSVDSTSVCTPACAGLSLDIGYGTVSAMPVIDGIGVRHAACRADFGGADVQVMHQASFAATPVTRLAVPQPVVSRRV
jgi:actin-related protein